MSETKETKIARKAIVIALGVICIILVACLGGVVVAYTLTINGKSNTISSLDYQISQLNSSVANLQRQVASDDSAIDFLTSQVASLQNQLNNTVEGVNEQLALRLTMTLQKTNYRLGEPINMTFTMTNISNQTINLAQYGAYRFGFLVYNDTNNSIYQTSLEFPLYPFNPGGLCVQCFPLNAEESFTEVLVWGQTCNKTAFSEGVPVSSGTYYIVGQTGYIFNVDFLNGYTMVETAPIQIVIA